MYQLWIADMMSVASLLHNAQHTWTNFLSQAALRKNLSEDLILNRNKSAYTIQFFIADKKSDLPNDFFSECHLAHTARFFYRSFCAVIMTGQVPLLDYITLIFSDCS